MKTKTSTRYATRTAYYRKVQQSLMHMLGMSPTYFYALELEIGLYLLSEYFGDTAAPQLTQRYVRELSQNARHVFWPWFINQKRQLDDSFAPHCRSLIELGGEPVDARLVYILELRAWAFESRTHERLRHFLTQSETLFV